MTFFMPFVTVPAAQVKLASRVRLIINIFFLFFITITLKDLYLFLLL